MGVAAVGDEDDELLPAVLRGVGGLVCVEVGSRVPQGAVHGGVGIGFLAVKAHGQAGRGHGGARRILLGLRAGRAVAVGVAVLVGIGRADAPADARHLGHEVQSQVVRDVPHPDVEARLVARVDLAVAVVVEQVEDGPLGDDVAPAVGHAHPVDDRAVFVSVRLINARRVSLHAAGQIEHDQHVRRRGVEQGRFIGAEPLWWGEGARDQKQGCRKPFPQGHRALLSGHGGDLDGAEADLDIDGHVRVICRVPPRDRCAVPCLPPHLRPPDGVSAQLQGGRARRGHDRLADRILRRRIVPAAERPIAHGEYRAVECRRRVEKPREFVHAGLGGIQRLLVSHGPHADPDIPAGEIDGQDPDGQEDQVGQKGRDEGKPFFLQAIFHSVIAFSE